MSAFSPDWLALREPADERSRSPKLLRALQRAHPAIVDLGAGTGANLRWLAPRLGPGQQWTLIDNDPELLATASNRLSAWAEHAGYQLRPRGSELEIVGPDFDFTFTTRELDLGHDLNEIELPRGSLVTAAALLDLVSRQWLEALVARVTESSASVLWALSYSGSVSLDPSHADDEAIVELVNRHQLTDKGFGPALGPDAPRVARELLERAGHAVHDSDSSWRCAAGDADLIHALVEGWAAAARETAPEQASRIESWREQRLKLASGGAGLRATVGHRDLVAVPNSAASGLEAAD